MVDEEALYELFKLMKANNYTESTYKTYYQNIALIDFKCQQLFEQDYSLQTLENKNGSLCAHYPPTIIIPRRKVSDSQESPHCEEAKDVLTFIPQARRARCRSRFVIPALCFKGKFICRSATLSGSLETWGRQAMAAAGSIPGFPRGQDNPSAESNPELGPGYGKELFDKLRGDDVGLLRSLNVKYISDFMVEKKKVKYMLTVTSSEKVDRYNRYQDFSILALPYPGCEFFKNWADNDYAMSGLFFNWNQSDVDVVLNFDLGKVPIIASHVLWSEYKSWDLTEMTTNYTTLLLGLLIEGTGGLLLHCVSGWDRTPLFVSILRCLLWAEGLAHDSLQPSELLYLTLAYDWFLFGHQLKNRLENGEEVLRYCFAFIEHAVDNLALSVKHVYGLLSDSPAATATNGTDESIEASASASTEDYISKRKERLELLSVLFKEFYRNIAPVKPSPVRMSSVRNGGFLSSFMGNLTGKW